MNGKSKHPPKRPWARSVARGIVGAMAMSGMRQVEVGLGFVHRTPPEAVLAEGVPAVLENVPQDRRKAAIELAHWGYGATAGALFALVPKRLRSSRITGPVYGALVWGAFELTVAPSLGLAHAHRSRPRERWALLADHVVFGFIVGTPPEVTVSGTAGRGGGSGGSGYGNGDRDEGRDDEGHRGGARDRGGNRESHQGGKRRRGRRRHRRHRS